MKKFFMSKACLALFLSATIGLSSCEKISDLNDDIDAKIDEMLGITALAEDLSKTSSNFNEIRDLLVSGKIASAEIKVNVSSGVPYSYTHKWYTLSGSAWNVKTTTYSGTIAKSYFTNTSTTNIVKVSVVNNVPKLYVNGALVSSGSTSGTGTGTGSGSGTGSGTTTPTTQTLYDQVIAGEAYEKKTIYFTLPSGVKSMVIRTTESSEAYRNTADMFVRKGSAPIVNGPKPPSYTPAYSWTADFAGVNPNREDEVYTVSNPTGTYYVTLYGYNTYYSSRLLVTITK